EQLVAERLVLAGQRQDAESAGGTRSADELLHRGEIGRHRTRAGGRRRRRARQVLHQPNEFQLGEELPRFRLVDRLALEVLELHRQRQVVVEGDQLAAAADLFDAGEEIFAQFWLFYTCCIFEDFVERAVLFEEARRGLLADAGH